MSARSHIEPLLPPSTARYWVGGSASWDATAGTKWSTSPGGIGGASVPTQNNDVYFTSQSGAVTCTVPSSTTVNCRNLILTGFTGTFKVNGTTSVINVYGPTVTFAASNTVNLTGMGVLNFVGSGTQTLTSAGKTLMSITVAGSSTVTLADNLTSSGTITLTSGTFNTASKTVSCSIFNASGTTARTLTLGSTGLTCTFAGVAWDISVATNFTMTSNTGTGACSGTNATFRSAQINYNGMAISMPGVGDMTIDSNNSTFTNVARIGTAVKTDTLVFASNITLTGVIAVLGNTVTNRVLVRSDVPGTARTITNNGSILFTNYVDFQDITGAGSYGWDLSAISSGNCGGNTGITFTTAATQTATGTSGFTWSTHGWTTRVPLPQDNVVINNSFSGGQTITMDMPRLGKSIDISGATGSPTIAVTATTAAFYGSLTLASGQTMSGTNTLVPSGRGTYSITTAGVTFTTALSFTAPTGTYTVTDNITCSSNSNYFTIGSAIGVVAGEAIFAGDVTLTGTTGGIWVVGGTLTMGSGTWSLGGTSGLPFSVSAGTVNPGTAEVVIANASASTRSILLAGASLDELTYTVAGSTGALAIMSGGTIGTLNFSDASNARILSLSAGSALTVTNFNISGTSGKLMTINSLTPGATATLSKSSGIVSSDYLSITDIIATGGAAWFAGTHSTDGGNNTGWTFMAPLVDSDTGTGVETQAISFGQTESGNAVEGWSIVVTISDSDAGFGLEDPTTVGETDTDTGSGSDDHSIAVTRTDADTGSGTETELLYLASADTGSGTDAHSVAAAFTDSDTGSASDSTAQSQSSSETGTGTDAHAIAASLSDNDTGAGLEDPTIVGETDTDTGFADDDHEISVELDDADTGSGDEDEFLLLTTADDASGSDDESIEAEFSDDDTGSGEETGTLTLSSAETGSAVDAHSIVATLSDSDTGSGLDAGTVDAGAVPVDNTDDDIGSGTETQHLYITSSDSGIGVDTASIAAAITVGDTGSGSEAITKGFTETETGTGTDSQSLHATLTDSDTGAGLEDPAVTSRTGADSGAGQDDALITARSFSSAEVGTAVETEAIMVSSSDTGSGADTHAQYLSSSDSGSATEAFDSIIAALTQDDVAFVAEAFAIGAQLAANDSGSGADELLAIRPFISLPTTAELATDGLTGALLLATRAAVELASDGTTKVSVGSDGHTSAIPATDGSNSAAVAADNTSVEVH